MGFLSCEKDAEKEVVPDGVFVSSVQPASGKVNSEVILMGRNFSQIIEENKVFLNDQELEIFSATSTEINLRVVHGVSSGKLKIEVKGESIIAGDFVVIPFSADDLIFNTLSPSAGPIGSSITITGNNFSLVPENNKVTFNTLPAKVLSATKTQLIVQVPEGASTGPVRIVVGSETSTGPVFIVSESPFITSFSPDKGLKGTSVTIKGSKFSTTAATNIVKFNGTVAEVVTATATELVVLVPKGAISGKLTVEVNNSTGESEKEFNVIAPYSISSIQPTKGQIGSMVVINGTNFNSDKDQNKVYFNGVLATINQASYNYLKVIVPEGATTGIIKVEIEDDLVGGPEYTVIVPPTISGLSPEVGQRGTNMVIKGSHFSPNPNDNLVTINNLPATVTLASETELTVQVPESATSGIVKVVVNGVSGLGPVFKVLLPPVISTFSPTRGERGATVAINGRNFSNIASENRVFFSSIEAVITSATSTKLVVMVPEGAETGKISITVNEMAVASTSNFTVLLEPIITGLSHYTGIRGSEIKIMGSNFSTVASENKIKFASGITTAKTSTSTELTVIVPGSATSGFIAVSVNGFEVSGPEFIVILPPVIFGFSTTSLLPGDLLTISGSNFDDDYSRNVVILSAANIEYPVEIISGTASELQVSIPESMTANSYIVKVVSKQQAVSRGTLNVNPILTSFTPEGGSALTLVTVYGSGFGNDKSNVTITCYHEFGTKTVTPLTVSKNTLTFELPAVYNQNHDLWIKVMVNGKQVISSNRFDYH